MQGSLSDRFVGGLNGKYAFHINMVLPIMYNITKILVPQLPIYFISISL